MYCNAMISIFQVHFVICRYFLLPQSAFGSQARLSSKCNTPEDLMRSEPTEAFSWAVINQVNYYLQLSIWQ